MTNNSMIEAKIKMMYGSGYIKLENNWFYVQNEKLIISDKSEIRLDTQDEIYKTIGRIDEDVDFIIEANIEVKTSFKNHIVIDYDATRRSEKRIGYTAHAVNKQIVFSTISGDFIKEEEKIMDYYGDGLWKVKTLHYPYTYKLFDEKSSDKTILPNANVYDELNVYTDDSKNELRIDYRTIYRSNKNSRYILNFVYDTLNRKLIQYVKTSVGSNEFKVGLTADKMLDTDMYNSRTLYSIEADRFVHESLLYRIDGDINNNYYKKIKETDRPDILIGTYIKGPRNTEFQRLIDYKGNIIIDNEYSLIKYLSNDTYILYKNENNRLESYIYNLNQGYIAELQTTKGNETDIASHCTLSIHPRLPLIMNNSEPGTKIGILRNRYVYVDEIQNFTRWFNTEASPDNKYLKIELGPTRKIITDAYLRDVSNETLIDTRIGNNWRKI